MPDKLTDSKVIKGLKLCIKRPCDKDCPYIRRIRCNDALMQDALDLINRLQEKVEKFENRQKPTGASGYKYEKGKVVFFTNMLGGCRYEYQNMFEVVKTLNELLQEAYAKDEIAFALKCKTEELETAKAEAYKEFANLVDKDISEKLSDSIKEQNPHLYLVHQIIKDLLKELVGDK